MRSRVLKKQIIFDLPLQVGLFVYFLTKFKMLKFVYDYIKKYQPDDCFEFIKIDTDSLQELVKPELRKEFLKLQLFFPSLACDQHKSEFVKN